MKKILRLLPLFILGYSTVCSSNEPQAKELNTLVWNCGQGRDLKVQLPSKQWQFAGSTSMDGNSVAYAADGKPSDEEIFYDSKLDQNSQVKYAARLVMQDSKTAPAPTIQLLVSDFKPPEFTASAIKKVDVNPLEKISVKEGPLEVFCTPVLPDNKKVYGDFLALKKQFSGPTAASTAPSAATLSLPPHWK